MVETRKFINVNESACRLYGYSRDEFLELKYSDITAEPDQLGCLHKGDAGRNADSSAASISQEKGWDRVSGGNIFQYIRVSGRKVFCGVVRDITERKKSGERT